MSCFLGVQHNRSTVTIDSNVDQAGNETTAKLFMQDVNFLGASEECRSFLTPFMCHYLFPLCDENIHHNLSRNQCNKIKDGVCKDTWNTALLFPSIKERLPRCENLPPETNYSVCNFSTEHLGICKNGFYTDITNGRCVPDCYQWKKISDEMAISVKAIVFITTILGFGSGILVIILSCYWRKKM